MQLTKTDGFISAVKEMNQTCFLRFLNLGSSNINKKEKKDSQTALVLGLEHFYSVELDSQIWK